MKAFKLKYDDGRCEVVYGKDSLSIVKKYDLANRSNVNTRIIELSGEQEVIALSHREYQS